ncbi:hypothetical protein [Methanosarcina sp. WWM596]|uniref:hypothetical protein n=1 Tax=Methanosarcina sp. WWM596 TaxID=1434103 RepID=UPI001E3B1BE3|nr:hypothetical protein [Methanosarcina sp. WWM596]
MPKSCGFILYILGMFFGLDNLFSGGLFVKYIKIYPICNTEFFVLESVVDKAVYCTLGCLVKAQGDTEMQKLLIFFP